MKRYRNKVTGAIIEIEGIGAGDWELIDAPASSSAKEEEKPVAPKKKTKKKEG